MLQRTIRRPQAVLLTALAACLGAAPAPAQAPVAGRMFDAVVEVLGRRYFDPAVRRHELPALAARYRPAARAALDRDAERAVVHELLSELGVSHLALYSDATHGRLMRELAGERGPTLGFHLQRIGASFYVRGVLEGGPAERAGLRVGDRVFEIDGRPVAESPRLDWRADDAGLLDPVVHGLLAAADERVELQCESTPGGRRSVVVAAAAYSALDAAVDSVAVLDVDGVRLGHVHLWFMHDDGVRRLVRRAIEDRFGDCDALLFDARGRGGSARAVFATLAELEDWGRPLAILVDRGTRSAKEVLALEVRRRGLGVVVGERTAGAVLPATFARVAPDAVLMFPASELDDYSEAIEGRGVMPDVLAPGVGPYGRGRDPILQRGVDVLVDEVLAARAGATGR